MRTMAIVVMGLFALGCGGDKDGDSGGGAATATGAGTGGGTATGGTATGTPEPRDGATVYGDICFVCHGDDGKGTTLGPDLEPIVAAFTDDEIVTAVLEGSGNMDPQAVTPEEAQNVAEYVRTLF